ncbi:MAG: hypothetical protein D4R65_10885 [Verrucomicrobiaceae bacterium]|nr:MAG: hypothetical protein D4R65_10885 [Verrucomicrobiaceae bacterium]
MYLSRLTDHTATPTATAEETRTLRELARRKAELLGSPAVAERTRLWKKHNALLQERPMLLVFPEGSWSELIASSEALQCRCSDPLLHQIEQEIRMELYAFEHFDTDNLPTPSVWVPKAIGNTGWGVEARWEMSQEAHGARKFDPVIAEESDLDKMRFPEVVHDEGLSERRFDAVNEIFDGILPVELVGIKHVSFHLMAQWTALRGLEEVLMDMIAEPEFTHRALAFLAEGNRRLIEQYESMGLLEFNHDNTYHSTGGNGWLESCPGPEAGATAKRANMWASAEAQELTVVSPAMHAEFALRYEKELLEPFALTGYGCCEDITDKCNLVLDIPHIRRISVSPFTNVARSAPQIGVRAIFSWKPKPTDLVGNFNPERIRSYLRENIAECRKSGCNFEVILKDTHTCERRPERFDDWSRIAREEIDRC